MKLDMRIQDARNRHKNSVLVCTDQSAAFNLVMSEIILSKMVVLGMDMLLRKLVESYLLGCSTQYRVGK